MHVAIFQAKIRALDAEYSRAAARIRELAIGELGCLDFHALTEGLEEARTMVRVVFRPSGESREGVPRGLLTGWCQASGWGRRGCSCCARFVGVPWR